MTNQRIVQGMNLRQIEMIIHKRARNIIIISQIHLREKELWYLKDAFEIPLRSSDQNHMIKNLWSNYPFSCLAITVYLAIFKYDGNFWDNFRKYIKINNTGLWKNLFLETIDKKDLKVFDQKGTQKYLNNILGHAGIPISNSHIFIRDIIIPSAENDLDAYEIYEQIKSESNSIIKGYHLYKGVIDFIKLGDEVSINIINRFLKLWKEQQRPFYELNRNYLPGHLLKSMDKYIAENEAFTYTQKNLIAQPKLRLNPSSLNVSIRLPIIKQRDPVINSVTWIITNKQTLESHKIPTAKLELSNGINEFLVEDYKKDYFILPNYQYKVELYMNNKLKVNFQFNLKNTLYFHPKTNEQLFDISKAFKELHLVTSNHNVEYITACNSQTYHYSMEGSWKKYSLVEIEATHIEQVIIENEIIHLSHKDSYPYLDGDYLENIAHEQLSVYKDPPILMVPQEFTPFFNNKSEWHLKVFSKSTGASERVSIPDVEKIYTTQEKVRIPLQSLQILRDTELDEFELMLYGPLGTDVTFNFILCHDIKVSVDQDLYSKRKKIKSIHFQTPITWGAEVTWPDDIKAIHRTVKNEFIDFRVISPSYLYKLIVQFTNNVTQKTIPLIIYTKPYDIKVVNEGYVYHSGSLTNKTQIALEKALVVIDLENPFLEKYKKNNPTISLLNKATGKHFPRNARIGKKSTINLSYFSDDTRKSNIELFCKLDYIDNDYQPLLFIDSNWKVKSFSYSYSKDLLELTWKESFPQENMQIKMWSLSKPAGNYQSFDLKKSQTTFKFNKPNPGYYLLEWSEKNTSAFAFLLEDETSLPNFKKEQYHIIKIDTPYTLAELTLLHSTEGFDYEFENTDFQNLIQGIKLYGPEYVSLLAKDYDACCDFGIRNIDFIIETIQSPEEDWETKEILLQLVGFAEWDYTSIKKIISHRSEKLTDNFLRTNRKYFGDKRSMEMIMKKNPSQLNVMLQQTEPDTMVIEDFGLNHAHLEFVKKMKTDMDYRHRILQMIEVEFLFIKNLFRRIKSNNILDRRIFTAIDKRDYQLENFQGHEYPYFIASVGLLNRILSISEPSFSIDERKRLRRVTKKVLETDRNWLTHDLLYLSAFYVMLYTPKNKERGNKHGNTPFKWKN